MPWRKLLPTGVKPRMFGRSRSSQPWPRAPEGQRAYVVGDVHGRLDLLDALLERIHRELEERPPDKAMLVFLGDLVDRGPQSAQVVERLRAYRRPGLRTVFLLGNHEEVLLRVLAGETSLIRSWLRFGGEQTLRSYGLDPRRIALADESALAALRRAIPDEHIAFLRAFADTRSSSATIAGWAQLRLRDCRITCQVAPVTGNASAPAMQPRA